LVINAPRWRVRQENARSFEEILHLGIGEGYAIYENIFDQLYPGCGVVVLDKDREQRAEGQLIELVPTTRTNKGIQRYDVRIRNLTKVLYRPERINRCGVSVIHR